MWGLCVCLLLLLLSILTIFDHVEESQAAKIPTLILPRTAIVVVIIIGICCITIVGAVIIPGVLCQLMGHVIPTRCGGVEQSAVHELELGLWVVVGGVVMIIIGIDVCASVLRGGGDSKLRDGAGGGEVAVGVGVVVIIRSACEGRGAGFVVCREQWVGCCSFVEDTRRPHSCTLICGGPTLRAVVCGVVVGGVEC